MGETKWVLAELTRIEVVWPLAVSLAATVAVQGLMAGRRRALLNEAMHELRRPLQALALSASSAPSLPVADGVTPEVDLSRQAAFALERLDREINGGPAPARREPIGVAELLDICVARWWWPAVESGGSIAVTGERIAAVVEGDRDGLSQALDNLVGNAIEHGGPMISLSAELGPDLVRISVADSGAARADQEKRRSAPRGAAALTGRRRRGHGLRVVRRVAATHSGEFRLRRSEAGTEAILELPLSSTEGVG